MQTRFKVLMIGAALTAASLPAIAQTADREDVPKDSDTAMVGSDRDRASQAALDHLGEGKVTDTEVGDEESYYEVEVTLDDGRQVDVQLDESFEVVGTEGDSAGSDG